MALKALLPSPARRFFVTLLRYVSVVLPLPLPYRYSMTVAPEFDVVISKDLQQHYPILTIREHVGQFQLIEPPSNKRMCMALIRHVDTGKQLLLPEEWYDLLFHPVPPSVNYGD